MLFAWVVQSLRTIYFVAHQFQFILPVWGAQQQAAQVVEGFGFNSHSPSGEHSSKNNQRLNARCFNSRSPYGEHSSLFCLFPRISGFNSRSPYGEHLMSSIDSALHVRFNSRSPYGEHCLFLNKHILKFRFVKSANLKLLKDFLRNTYRETISFFSCRC